MNEHARNFNITLPSNSCQDSHPYNNGSKYTIELGESINLEGKWKVALTEIKCDFPIYTIPHNSKIYVETIYLPLAFLSKSKLTFPSTPNLGKYYNVKQENDKLIIENDELSNYYFGFIFNTYDDAKRAGFNHRKIMGYEKIKASNPHNLYGNDKVAARSYTIPLTDMEILEDGNFISTDGITLSNKDNTFKVVGSTKLVIITHHTQPFHIIFDSLEDANKVGFNSTDIYGFVGLTADYHHSLKKGEKIEFELRYTKYGGDWKEKKEYILTYVDRYFANASILAKWLNTHGLPFKFKSKNRKLLITEADHVQKLLFSLPLQYILGFQSNTLPYNNLTAEFEPQIDRAYNQLFIYSNIANYTQVGESLVPLLRHIGIKKDLTYGKQFVFNPKNPMYIDVNHSTITQIEINIRDNGGKLIPFTESAVTTITLNFKQII